MASERRDFGTCANCEGHIVICLPPRRAAKMVRATFEISWKRPDDEVARERTLALFSDCKIREAKRHEPFEHACETRRHKTSKEAMDRLRDALEKAGDDVVDITVSVGR